MTSISDREKLLSRYGRQMLLPAIGSGGQDQIMQHKVLIVGAGGIGSSVAMYLASSGVQLTILDDDVVDCSNLHR
jgi:molybdopterin/thiamine biosynthesis adenylyltransferase